MSEFKVLIVSGSSENNDWSESDPFLSKLSNIINKIGYNVECVSSDENLYSILKKETNALVFNLVPLIESKNSWFIPALCDYLRIPYTGSGIFTISVLRNNYYKEILRYYGIDEDKTHTPQQKIRLSILGNRSKIIYHPFLLDTSGIQSKLRKFSEKFLEKVMTTTQTIIKALKLYDYFIIDYNIMFNSNENLYLDRIIPSPSLTIDSIYCQSLNAIDLSHEEIIALILITSMKRNKISLSESSLRLYEKFNQLITNPPKSIERFCMEES